MTMEMFDYDYYVNEAADERVKDWMFMSGPRTPLLLCGMYLYLIYSLLPRFMQARKPYSLAQPIRLYNILQIALNAYIVYGVSTSGWTTTYDLLCEPIDYSNDPMALKMLGMFWLTTVTKLIEFIETIIFALRKKNTQITGLHVYHHVSTFLWAWLGTKYTGGGLTSFLIIINSSVHVVMYLYYFLSSFGPNVQKKLAPWKPWLTKIQLTQFVILMLYALQSLRPSCKLPNLLIIMFFSNVIVLTKMFSDFYKRSYVRNTKRERN